LKEEGFITGYEVMPSGAFRELIVQLKYYEGKRVIRNIERVSKPGLRTYQRSQDLKKVLGGQGISILSTSHGVMSDKECRSRKIGGEVLCQVW
ncbi:MAG: 30S ribosomal protein S8, partial [SAR324 cluster bacterium]|nr:30S ribosomal protein S8 [SAR324 cluster bacterium]MEC7217016.1 30S ribosomal protein S8 [SAR324 cluster bacterium]